MFKKKEKQKDKENSQEGLGIDKIINVGPIKLLAPHEHKLDEYLNKFESYSKNFAKISKIILSYFNSECIILDIGANIGDSIALLRNEGIINKIISIEGSEFYYNYLLKNLPQLGDVEIFQNYLSQEKTEETLELNIKNGTGELRISETNTINLITLDNLLTTKLNNREIKIIKIDTDGFDFKILKGSKETIIKFKPVLYFEYDELLNRNHNENIFEVFDFLRDLDYFDIVFYDNYGRLLISTNLKSNTQLSQLHEYISNGKGAFPYYDVLVFPKDHSHLAEIIIKKIEE